MTIPDGEGYCVEVDILPGTGRVYLGTSEPGVWLNAAAQERFDQTWAAARREAGGHA